MTKLNYTTVIKGGLFCFPDPEKLCFRWSKPSKGLITSLDRKESLFCFHLIMETHMLCLQKSPLPCKLTGWVSDNSYISYFTIFIWWYSKGPIFNAAFILFGYNSASVAHTGLAKEKGEICMCICMDGYWCVSDMLDLKPVSLFLAFIIRLCGFVLFKLGQYVYSTSLRLLASGCAFWNGTVLHPFLKWAPACHFSGGFPPLVTL